MSFNIVKTQLDKFKNIHSICKTIELITILTLQFYSYKMINGIKMIPLMFCYVKECYRLNNVLKSHLVVPFFSDKSCSGIINNKLLFFLKETFLLMRYNNVLASLVGTSLNFKRNIFFTSFSEDTILNLYNLSSETVNFYSSFLVFKEILLLNNTMFYNSKYKDTNITLDVTSKSNYLEEYNKEIDLSLKVTKKSAFNNNKQFYSTTIVKPNLIYTCTGFDSVPDLNEVECMNSFFESIFNSYNSPLKFSSFSVVNNDNKLLIYYQCIDKTIGDCTIGAFSIVYSTYDVYKYNNKNYNYYTIYYIDEESFLWENDSSYEIKYCYYYHKEDTSIFYTNIFSSYIRKIYKRNNIKNKNLLNNIKQGIKMLKKYNQVDEK